MLNWQYVLNKSFMYHFRPVTSSNESEALLSPLAVVSIRAQNPIRGLPARIYSAPFLTIPANITNELKDVFDKMGIYHECKQWFGNDMTDFKKLRSKFRESFVFLSTVRYR